MQFNHVSRHFSDLMAELHPVYHVTKQKDTLCMLEFHLTLQKQCDIIVTLILSPTTHLRYTYYKIINYYHHLKEFYFKEKNQFKQIWTVLHNLKEKHSFRKVFVFSCILKEPSKFCVHIWSYVRLLPAYPRIAVCR